MGNNSCENFWKEKQLFGTNAYQSTLNKHSPQIAKANGF